MTDRDRYAWIITRGGFVAAVIGLAALAWPIVRGF